MRIPLRFIAILAFLALVASACWRPSVTPDYEYTVETNVAYGPGEILGGGEFVNLELDLYLPEVEGQSRFPLVVLIHGGGFFNGSKAQMAGQAAAFARRGYAAAAINYRLAGTDPIPSERVGPVYESVGGASAPALVRSVVAAIDDTLTALDYLHTRPEIYPGQTVLSGNSAGAITALFVSYGLDDFGIERPLVQATISNSGGFVGGASAAELIEENFGVINTDSYYYAEGPLYLSHATGDDTVAFSLAQDIIDRAVAVGHPHRTFILDANRHGFPILTTEVEPGVTVFEDQIRWLDEEVLAGVPAG